MIARIYALILKEFLALFLDKSSRMAIIVPPIIQLFVFGYAATFDLNKVRLAILNEDSGAVSRELISRFQGNPTFDIVAHLQSEHGIAAMIDHEKTLMVLRIDNACSRQAVRGESCSVQVLIDGRNSNTAMLALNYVRAIVTDFNEELMARQNLGLPARLAVRAWFNPNLESRWFIVPGIIALLGMIVTLVVTALSVAREREDGTFDQLLVTPMRPWEVMVGKSLPGLLVGLFEVSLIIALTVYWFKIPLHGSLLTLYPALVIYLLSVIGVGLMISSFSTTLQQALLGSILFIVPAVTLSGFTTPIANMPLWMQHLTIINPMRYFLIVVRRVFLEGTEIRFLVHEIWPMAVIAVCTLSLATWLFRHRLH
ncbi:MAG: ABC transporter permease [bacterium]|nr:ABC transporter permease [bacterium]